ncbi:fibro-slime domain-containing protein [Polyangium sp. y55x31]|uniref:fibro-slime domain-containing protein n=1 Tax=Polyangium sp. y55x31 TaxID=3042688 RepID=UPI00248246DF|nr:fibro-slime domain-containing protein [Polyangium sp. y55x31]MDI1476500.1 fibro-slime domain-containing protein [Polyangium sp. y55x31]
MRATILSLFGLVFVLGCSSGQGSGSPTGATTSSSGSGSGGGGSGGAGTGGAGGEGGLNLTTSSSGSGGDTGEECLNTLTMRVRDFSESHPDFQWGDHPNFPQIVGVRPGILAAELAKQPDGSFKPVYAAGNDVSPNGPSYAPFTGAANFDAWYRDTPGVNFATNVQIPLTGNGTTLVYDDANFHPIDATFGFGDEGFVLNGMPNNWHFTTEALVSFRYKGGEVFTFRGDDDIWVFINHRLAIDLGGIHGPEQGVVDLDQSAAALGLVPGGVYDLQVFHAERNYSGSNYRFETSNFCFLPVDPPK